MHDRPPVLFALGASRHWGQSVAAGLGAELSPHEERYFEDGEHKARPLASVRGRDVYVLHSLYADAQQSVNDKLCQLLFFLGAVKDSAAGRVTAVVPYLGYARKDRKTKSRDPVTTRYVAALFEAVGADRIVTLDVHNLAAYQNAFRCGTEHLEANGLFVAHFRGIVGRREAVVVAPDAGGIKRAENFRQRLSAALGRPVAAAFAEKHRSEGVVSGELLVGDVEGRCAIIIDDLISSGGTIARTARACLERGATTVYAAATHGLFTVDAAEKLSEPGLEALVVTDTVVPSHLPEGSATRAKLTVLPTAPLFAQAIDRLHTDGSITELLEG